MTTGDTNMLIDSTRLVASSDLEDRLQTVLRKADADIIRKVYDVDGVFFTKLSITGATDVFTINGTSESTDGDGHILDHILATEDGSSIPFENENAIPYYVAFTWCERPKGIQINPRTGDPEYIEEIEDIGDQGDPNSVVDNGTNITFNINDLTESGVDFSGREAVVYLKVPADGATTEAIAIETCTIAFGTPNNTITTTGLLGQSTVSTTASDYEVVVLGPTVRRNTDLRTIDDIVFIGIVTGGGAGNPPSGFDITDQRRIDATLSSLNDILDAFAETLPVDSSEAGAQKNILTGLPTLTMPCCIRMDKSS